jgi:hypothetical protein
LAKFKMPKIIKVKDQLLVAESLVTLVPCMSGSRLFMATLTGQSC